MSDSLIYLLLLFGNYLIYTIDIKMAMNNKKVMVEVCL